MNKKQMFEYISLKSGVNSQKVKEIFEDFQEILSDALCKGEKVTLSGFGKFFVVDRKSIKRRNPVTKRMYYTRASKVTIFKAYKKLKHCVN